jgi:hypothetical protein
MRQAILALALVMAAALGTPGASAQPPRPGRTLLVAVNLQRPEADIPLRALARVFRGEQRFWENGDRVYPVLVPEDQPEARAAFLGSVVKLEARAFALHWRNLVFRGDVTDQPISPPDERRAVQSVFAERGAIALVEGTATRNLSRVAKVLTVDGRAREAADYPLKW